MSDTIHWNGKIVPFRPGETVSSALMRAGITGFGKSPTGQAAGMFCGIGQCQSCLVEFDGTLTEACLLQCRDGMRLFAQGGTDA
ncbi:MAG: 2Fe-2S iron-sulfur cluster-binding protein [Oricola sp.]